FEANLHDDGAIVRMTPGRAGCMRFEDPEEELLELRGPRHVARRLGADASRLLVTRVPVTPPAWRWTRQDPQDSAYMALVNRCSRLERLIELNAPRIILINEERMTQLALERVCEVVRRELLALLGWRPSAPVSPRSTALLRAVYADPDLDEPREAFAEHLAAQGDERGEFIRLQLEDVGRRRRRAPRRERDLLRRHHDEWLAPLERAVERVEFRRGFPCSGRTVRARAEPLIGDPAWSTFEELETELPALIAHPGLPVLRKITCSWGCFAALAEQDRRLTELGAAVITPRRYPPTKHAQVVRSPVFPALRELTVIQRSRRAQDWGWLLASPLGARLEELTIALPHAHLEALSLLPWCALLRPRLRLALSFGRPLRVTLELDERDRVEVSVATTRAFAEYVALGDGAIARELARALLELEPDRIASLRLRSRSRWYGEALESLAAAVLDRFGDLVTLPRFYAPPTSA
ncbi:MAG: TIGR02996 domain-containing protein, partial [Myxococcales bacterium]|nr:TIGR02996 domain-containing protein [Myxococcales bacterium]